MNRATFVSDVTAAACGQWPELLAAMGIDTPSRGKHGPCPACGGKDRFRLDDKGGRGTFICNQCGSGDGLDLVAKVTGKPAKEAAKLIAPLVGLAAGGVDPAELEHLRQQQQARAEAEQQQKRIRRQKAARRAAAIIRDCKPGQTPYLEQKALQGLAVPLTQHIIAVGELIFQPGALVVPLWDEARELVNVQLISPQGNKCYLAGGQKNGAFHRITGDELVAVCEGYATGLSVHLATGATVYCAMDANNLLAVARMVRGMDDPLQPCRVILCADNDANTEGNPGKTKAEQAAAAIGARVALPPLPGDWNDYHQAHGLTATKEAIMGAAALTTPIEPTQAASQKEQGAIQAEVAPLPISANAREREPEPSADVTDEVTENELPEGFRLTKNALFALELVGKGDDAKQVYVCVSSPVRVLAETVDEHEQNYGRLLEWRDSRGKIHEWAMPACLLVKRNGEEMFSALMSGGLPFIAQEHKRKLAAYLMRCKPGKRIISVERTGWHGRAYVLPGETIGLDAEGVILQTAGYTTSDFTECGTLAGWQQGVAGLAVSNSRLCFALSLAFASPLLSLVGMEGGGFHLKGSSSDGKSIITEAAASVYGNPRRYVQTWRTTGNGIEGIASRRNDALLCLDELGQVDGREAGEMAYMLANGQGKGRSKQDGELRERKAWRLLFLSNGELSLEDHAASVGQRIQAGMEVRTIQIPSETGKYRAFEYLHGMEGSAVFADTLKANAAGQYGTAFRAFIEALATNLDQHREHLRGEIKRLTDELTPKDAGSQVNRAIRRFALVAAAGELATALGVTGWPAGEAVRAARICIKAWLDERGHLGNKEDAATLQQVRGFVVAHQYTRFADWFKDDHRPANMVGYRRVEADGVIFLIPPTGWLEITKGRDPKRAAQLCLEAGYLLKSKERLQRKVRLPGMNGSVWVYQLTQRVIADEAGGPDDEDKDE